MTEEERKDYIYEWSEGIDRHNTVKEISTLCTLCDSGLMTGNEVREKLGMKPVEFKNKER